ncbi:hypothetical protein CFOL_v3_07839 [Cephalotus follicularis]|uniref:Uncharacterized protein n=1 Tax=Cephalotus follicularis TaxID=3775 RepID=A0A1Q3B8E9_CEPFO|nr:hypothetical protein CFOL_v3_07839 [Cephalotus follicularis]
MKPSSELRIIKFHHLDTIHKAKKRVRVVKRRDNALWEASRLALREIERLEAQQLHAADLKTQQEASPLALLEKKDDDEEAVIEDNFEIMKGFEIHNIPPAAAELKRERENGFESHNLGAAARAERQALRLALNDAMSELFKAAKELFPGSP